MSHAVQFRHTLRRVRASLRTGGGAVPCQQTSVAVPRRRVRHVVAAIQEDCLQQVAAACTSATAYVSRASQEFLSSGNNIMTSLVIQFFIRQPQRWSACPDLIRAPHLTRVALAIVICFHICTASIARIDEVVLSQQHLLHATAHSPSLRPSY